MFGIKKNVNQNEDTICALCEYSSEKDGKFYCNSKPVNPTGYCSRFLFDPLKKKVKRISIKVQFQL